MSPARPLSLSPTPRAVVRGLHGPAGEPVAARRPNAGSHGGRASGEDFHGRAQLSARRDAMAGWLQGDRGHAGSEGTVATSPGTCRKRAFLLGGIFLGVFRQGLSYLEPRGRWEWQEGPACSVCGRREALASDRAAAGVPVSVGRAGLRPRVSVRGSWRADRRSRRGSLLWLSPLCN